MTQPFAGAPIVFGYSTVSLRAKSTPFATCVLVLGADMAQYFFQVAGLDNPFLGE
jgi:hypothetical protein